LQFLGKISRGGMDMAVKKNVEEAADDGGQE
jgi:hypothetical protein